MSEPLPTSAPDAPRMTLVQPAQATSDDALVDSYRRLADVFHDVLSEQSLDALLDRVADTLAELIPDDMHIYRPTRRSRS